MIFDPVRDCEHGRLKGKCDTCDLAQAEARIAELEAALRDLAEAFDWHDPRVAKAYEVLGERK